MLVQAQGEFSNASITHFSVNSGSEGNNIFAVCNKVIELLKHTPIEQIDFAYCIQFANELEPNCVTCEDIVSVSDLIEFIFDLSMESKRQNKQKLEKLSQEFFQELKILIEDFTQSQFVNENTIKVYNKIESATKKSSDLLKQLSHNIDHLEDEIQINSENLNKMNQKIDIQENERKSSSSLTKISSWITNHFIFIKKESHLAIFYIWTHLTLENASSATKKLVSLPAKVFSYVICANVSKLIEDTHLMEWLGAGVAIVCLYNRPEILTIVKLAGIALAYYIVKTQVFNEANYQRNKHYLFYWLNKVKILKTLDLKQ